MAEQKPKAGSGWINVAVDYGPLLPLAARLLPDAAVRACYVKGLGSYSAKSKAIEAKVALKGIGRALDALAADPAHAVFVARMRALAGQFRYEIMNDLLTKALHEPDAA